VKVDNAIVAKYIFCCNLTKLLKAIIIYYYLFIVIYLDTFLVNLVRNKSVLHYYIGVFDK
jgi:hypothetical protein